MPAQKITAFLVLFLAFLLVQDCHGSSPTTEEVLSAIKEAKQTNAAKRLTDIHKRARRQSTGGVVKSKCPALMSAYHGTAELYDEGKAIMADDMLAATKLLMNKGYSLPELQVPATSAIFQTEFECSPPGIECDPLYPYRMQDGSCNNLINPTWGMTGTAEIRDLGLVAYDDGLNTPRATSFGGGSLPSPRTISNIVHHQDGEIFSDVLSLAMFAFGQFLDHDLGLTDEAELIEDCCDPAEDSPNCFNIPIDGANDPIQNGENCMPFIRSAVAPSCGPGHREQPNSITHFIDNSNIYGSTIERLNELRYPGTAFLKMKREFDFGLPWYWRLPDDPSPDLHLCDSDEESGFFCTLAGDIRVNDVPTLTSVHQMGVKEHNRLAWKFRRYFKDQETLFQEARKVVNAQFQYITYNEFLPKIFSPDAMTQYGLWSSTPYQYDENINPSLSNEFLISYRFHTWIPDFMKIFTRYLTPVLLNGEVDPETDKKTDDTFFVMNMTYYHKRVGTPRRRLQGLDGLLHYVAGTAAQATDRFMVGSIRNNLFKDTEANKALDLVAFNIQRARDHGLPSYNEYRIFCGLSSGPISCSDLVDHDATTRELLRQAYNDECNDIDLWVGAHSETPVANSVVGPLLQCILGRQFQRLKYADRYWYQNPDAGFNSDQIAEIEKTSLSRLMCDNMKFKIVSPDSFAKPDSSNYVPCEDIPKLDLKKFKPPRAKVSSLAAVDPSFMDDDLPLDDLESLDFNSYLESLKKP